LEDETEFAYKCDDLYNPSGEWWIIYNDPDINISWKDIIKTHDIKDITLSEKDKKNISLKKFDKVNPF
jgi:dTDP-4-dehydrorhamnose 3,5-epimerase